MRKTLLVLLTLFVASAAYAQRPFEKVDKDGDGKLTIEEFLQGIKTEKHEGMSKTFAKRDKDGDGFLTADEFKSNSKKKKKTKA